MMRTKPKNNYGQAYAEVLEIVRHLPRDDKDKIPKRVLNKLMGEADENSDFIYNVGVPFREQEISREAKQILAEFSERYWNDRKSA